MNTHQFHVSSCLGKPCASFNTQLDQSASGTVSPFPQSSPDPHPVSNIFRGGEPCIGSQLLNVLLTRSISKSGHETND
ncbi:hypothetical protein K437DRAFT_112336 [Tilletiaria anomala UBC 951]|uniref:Uncharacterized protein n=1 Tax=Tilletiaria anomala (strain ATCC 24038 / CBS 436.72 / UBC 951) TaxID=1037660 RepID=A0A066W4F7_TILAU|nr:uncharacterized protein K437DRAFT_112336 [Tilletiaria anomala UBC 951]KDN45954.1 hypothetical protein K437DRAFT_112336 [Tilletiaria anomala UBC 951]